MPRPPLRRLFWPVSVLSLPALIVLAVLFTVDALGLGYAVLAAVVSVVGIAVLIRNFLTDIDTISIYVDGLPEDPAAAPPQLAQSGPLANLVAALGGVRRALAAQRGDGGEGDGTGLDAVPDPLLMLDGERRVVRTNAAARRLLGANLAGRDLASVLRNPALLEAVDRVAPGEEGTEVEFALHAPVERNFSAHIARLPAPAPDGSLVVIALYDITAMKRAEEMRSDFIANASHELRTPVSVLLGCIQTLRGSARDDPEAQAEFFGLMQAQAERMSRLVDDLLSLSRIEMNEHTIPSDGVDIRHIVGQVGDSLAFNAGARGMTIATDFPEELPVIAGDKDELTQVFQNLIDNAVKYGAEDSTIRIGAHLSREAPPSLPGEGEYMVITIEDRGEGIPSEHLPRLTERFYRVDTARSRELGGTGLGLAIVKHVVNRHRGALSIDSIPGEGSVFTVYLPATAPDGGEGEASSGAATRGKGTGSSA